MKYCKYAPMPNRGFMGVIIFPHLIIPQRDSDFLEIKYEEENPPLTYVNCNNPLLRLFSVERRYGARDTKMRQEDTT